MINETRNEYNEWYWKIITLPALERILVYCRNQNKSWGLEATRDNLIPILKHLKRWEEDIIHIDERIKTDLFAVRNFTDYEKLMAA
ncbi:MAG: hypothetical protein WCL18_05920 [bacterium]